MPKSVCVGGSSPWGRIQSVKVFADGVVFVSTAGHGGFWLSTERNRDLQSMMPFNTFAGGCWYEEDCDACLVAAAFPDLFGGAIVLGALRRIAGNSYYGEANQAFARAELAPPPADSFVCV
jgi:hypothetical protein